MAVPNTFATATSAIPLSNLDVNFAYYDAGFSLSGSAVTFAGSITLTTGTANGVPYLNGSKVLTSGGVLTFNGTILSSTGFAGALNGTVGATTASTGAFTTLSASSTVSGAGFSTYLASPPAIGGTAAAAGTFTALTGTSITNSGLTATRVVYSGTAGLETDSANLTFNGTILTSTGFAGPLNGTVGATTANTGAFTTLTTTGTINLITVGRGAGAIATNTAVGTSALAANTTGANNTAVGNQALVVNTTGALNAAFGAGALQNATTADANTALGIGAQLFTTTGAGNTSVGRIALFYNTTGASNVAVGKEALLNNTTASNSTAVGYQAMYSNTTASNNTAVGYQAAYTNTTGADNVAVGKGALYTNSTGSFNTAFGTSALTVNTVSYNSAFGSSALAANTTGAENAIFGGIAGFVNTTGSGLTGMGYVALRFNTTGSNNTAIGDAALYSNTTASNNTAVGYQAGYTNTTGSGFTFVGNLAGYSHSTGTQNTFMGDRAGFSTSTASNNTAFGNQALFNATGGLNTAIGQFSGNGVTTGTNNTFVGQTSGSAVTSGASNTIIGRYTGSAAPISATGSNYIVLSDGDGNVRGTFDSSGNLGIGTTSPVYRLDTDGSAVRFTRSSKYLILNPNYNAANTNVDLEISSGMALTFSIGGGVEKMRLDSAGNLGLGVTPSAWDAAGRINVPNNGALIAQGTSLDLGTNWYYNAGFKYATTAAATRLLQTGGAYQFFNAPSGTGGNAITFTQAMTLDASGRLGVGPTSMSAQLHIQNANGNSGLGSDNTGMALVESTFASNSQNANASFVAKNYYGYTQLMQWQNFGVRFGSRSVANGGAGDLVFTYGADTEGMRLSSGNLLVGATATASYFDGKLNVFNAGVGASLKNDVAALPSLIAWNAATSGDNKFVTFTTETSATERGTISYNRTGGLTVYSTTSDYRAKDITGPVNGSGALIDSVPVYTGKMKGATQERPMFIAHETPAYAHTGEKDAVDADGNPVYQQMDASALIPVMWAEIQDLRKRLAALEAI